MEIIDNINTLLGDDLNQLVRPRSNRDHCYDKCNHARLKRITKALNKFIIPQDAAPAVSLDVYEDIEETENIILE